MDLNSITFIVLGGLAVPAFILFFIKLKRQQDEIKALIETKFGEKKIILRDPMACLIAQQSRGYSQSRGNGNLILAEDELFFALALPKIVISIPLKNVGDMERVSRMCAQQLVGRCILKIHYTDDQGEEDALGIKLKKMDHWEAEIRRLQSRSKSQARA